MNLEEKRMFCKELIADLQNTVLTRLERVPEEWDGDELRLYLSDLFREQVCDNVMKGARLKEYRNAVLVLNL